MPEASTPVIAPEAAPVLPAPVPQPLPAPPPPEAQSAPASPDAVEDEGSWIWLVAAIAAAGVLGLLVFRKFRRRDEGVEGSQPVFVEAQPMPAPSPEPVMAPLPVAPSRAVPPQSAPPPAAAPATSGLVGIQVRPWLELEFRPDRAAATLTDASVQYELIIRNKGNAPARNIRIEQRMFNAGPEQEQEIGAFYAEPVRERTAPAIAAIPARGEMRLRNAISMPNEAVREITVQGRRLFIPTVAFNVIYDYGDGRAGQTSKSYVVGREADTPSEKMGAFRLDLGPRLYRSVGQRQTRLQRIV